MITGIFKPDIKRQSVPTDRPSSCVQKTHKLDTYRKPSLTNELSSYMQETCKLDSYRTPSPPIGEGANQITPVTKRSASHSSLLKSQISYRVDMDRQISVEALRVTRKNIPWNQFRSIYLCNFSITARPKLTINSVKQIGQGDWEESVLWDRLSSVLHKEVCCSSALSYVSQSDLLDRFFVISSYSIAALKRYTTLTGARRCLPNPILFSMLVKSLQNGQMWNFCLNIPGAAKGLMINSCSGCAMPGVCSIINLSAVISMGSYF